MIRADIPTYVDGLAAELAECVLMEANIARDCKRRQAGDAFSAYLNRAEAMLEACLRLQGRWTNHPDSARCMFWLCRYVEGP